MPRLRQNLRAPEEQAMLAGMIAMLRAQGEVRRVEAGPRGQMRLQLANGLTVSVIAGVAHLGQFAEVAWWPTGERNPYADVDGAGSPDDLANLLHVLVARGLKAYRGSPGGLPRWAGG